uniref:Uncharacterized protein n=1 Tax=Anguilla anguilla TaxID=7936 RepID=A0A0E9QT89_ANGAN
MRSIKYGYLLHLSPLHLCTLKAGRACCGKLLKSFHSVK